MAGNMESRFSPVQLAYISSIFGISIGALVELTCCTCMHIGILSFDAEFGKIIDNFQPIHKGAKRNSLIVNPRPSSR
jgi:hypothetical protein